jgi:DNA-binding response OmpR family regulator
MADFSYFPPSIPVQETPNNWLLLRGGTAGWRSGKQAKGFDVLIVEDDPVLRRTIAFSLQSEGYQVLSARDGVDALRVLETATPWLILLDMRLPGMDGADFAAEVRARNIPTTFVVVTGTREPRAAAREIGAEDFIAKPFDVDELVDLVHRHRAA